MQRVNCQLPECAAERLAAAAFARLVSGCSSLVALDIVYCTANILEFQGQGVGLSQQRSSLQQQLALFAASPVLFAPASWASQRCLTQLTIGMASSTRSPAHSSLLGAMLHAAVQAPSLRHLSLSAVPPKQQQAAFFEALSALTNLTRLSWPQTTAGGPLTAARNVTSLRSVRVNSHPSSDIVLPSAMTHLPLLTEQRLFCPGASLDMQQLAGLTSLRHLVVKYFTCRGRLLDIFPLMQLTFLTLPRIVPPPTAQAGAVAQQQAQQQMQQQQQQQAAGMPSHLEVPAAWKLGLQALSCWHGPVALLPQLDGTRLLLCEANVSPEFFWALSQLPKLASLRIVNARVLPQMPASPPHALRPLLPSLLCAALKVQSPNAAVVLERLATWARAPTGRRSQLITSGNTLVMPISDWSPSWLSPVLKCNQEEHVHLGGDAGALLLTAHARCSQQLVDGSSSVQLSRLGRVSDR